MQTQPRTSRSVFTAYKLLIKYSIYVIVLEGGSVKSFVASVEEVPCISDILGRKKTLIFKSKVRNSKGEYWGRFV